MARCGCAGGTCNCVIINGTGTTVTGSGTPANPYVISAQSALSVVDSATVDHTLTGTGTVDNPYSLSSAVRVDPIAGNLVKSGPAGLSVSCADVVACTDLSWRPIYKAKTSPQTVTNSATLADDAELFLNLPAGTWEVLAMIALLPGGDAGDIKTAWANTGSMSGGARYAIGAPTTVTDDTNTSVRVSVHSLGTQVPYGVPPSGNPSAGYLSERLVMTVTDAGVLTFRWAQSSANAVGTTVNTGSYLVARRLA